MKMTGFHRPIGLLNDYEEQDLSVLHFILFCKKRIFHSLKELGHGTILLLTKFDFVGMII